jgi:catechol 2,3-dioxygenase-like lactoylglutathione lyase family enzyme
MVNANCIEGPNDGGAQTGVHTVTDESAPTTTRPILTSISAQLFVADIQASFDFFTGKLGFVADFAYGDPPFYGQVSRDNARLSLRHMDEPVFAGGVREREDLLSATITLDSASGIRELFGAYETAGVAFHQTLRPEPWEALTFVVRDPDGNLILFAGPAD